MGRLFFLLLWGGLLLPAAGAQPAGPFSRLRLSAGPAFDVGGGALHRYWRPARGGSFAVAAPFYAGEVVLEAEAQQFRAAAEGVADFRALLVAVGWDAGLGLPGPFTARLGGRMGACQMSFQASPFAGGRSESELTLVGAGGLEAALNRRWSVYARAGYQKTFTYIRMRPVFVYAGVGYSLPTPRRLRRALL